ncbi:MFS transporter [Dysgonomonas sp. BGC7]|uniref:MFS transporter n=1 Tax=Dysgonomonas sp. BGC7 TaxID=1658008 RepID=UPI00068328B6|nr:MFS transporter [Dysgonomonas sp. BGC7]MBD8388589.1 MFS transporter [Dysgonomonas sp. BGC7]
MIKRIINFYKISTPSPFFIGNKEELTKKYKRLRISSFLAATIGYSLYYVCRTSLNVVKKPILESGALDASQLGVVGSVLLFSYAIGKFINGFLADYSNIKRFMATGLIISTAANLIVGLLGLAEMSTTAISTFTFFVAFAVMWGINGWSQAMGAAPAIISLSRWFPLKERGTYYGFFSASHNLGEFLSFIFVGAIVGLLGWQWGFIGSSVAGVLGVLIIICFLHDTPQSRGLPAVEVLADETVDSSEGNKKKQTTKEVQKAVLKNPLVWVLALSSAFMYISRYAINGWGVLFLQEAKGYSLATATQIISINALLGVIGTIFSGWISDKLFKGNRNIPAFLFGILNTLSLCLFLYSGDNIYINMLSMILFGTAIGVLICFLGGLMAVDIVPRNASGAALGIVGIASYIGAGIQDIISGWLIDSNKTIVNGVESYNFTQAGIFWIIASILSFVLILCVWKKNEKNKVSDTE